MTTPGYVTRPRFQAMFEFEKALFAWSLALTLAGVLVVWSGLDMALGWLASWEPPSRLGLGEMWPSSLGLPMSWRPIVPTVGFAVGAFMSSVGRRRDVALAALAAAPGLYVAAPVGVFNIVGLWLLWLVSQVVYIPIAVARWLLELLSRFVSDGWARLRQVVAALRRERRPEIGPTNSM
jgi:hypothetical protein